MMEFLATIFFSCFAGYCVYWIFHRRLWSGKRNWFFTRYLGFDDYDSMRHAAKIKFLLGFALLSLFTINEMLREYGHFLDAAIFLQAGYCLGYLQFLQIPQANWDNSDLPVRQN